MLDGTYSGLQASIAAFLNRTDLSAYIPDFIRAAEVQMQRRFVKDGGVTRMLARTDISLTAEFCTVPADFLASDTVLVSGSETASGLLQLEYATPSEINDLKAYYQGDGCPSGVPRRFTVAGNSYQFWPWNGGTVPAELTYIQAIPPLATNTSGNWLSLSYPDAYLYTSLMQSAPFLKNDARLQTWGTFATQIVQDIIDADKAMRTASKIAIPPRLVV